MLFQVLCGFEPIFYTTHPNEESNIFLNTFLLKLSTGFAMRNYAESLSKV